MRLRLRQWLMFHKFTDFLWIQRLVCLVIGHDAHSDQCNLPDHDYCIWCMKLTPGKAKS